jgi:hypothetical protein
MSNTPDLNVTLGGDITDFATKLELLTKWRAATDALEAHENEDPLDKFVGQRFGCPTWRRLADAIQAIETQMMDAGMPSPSCDIYQGPDGAELYGADLADCD